MNRSKVFSVRGGVVSTIIAVGALSAVLMVGGCGGDDGDSNPADPGGTPPPAHTHNWGNWAVTTSATCTSDGVETRTCQTDASHTEPRAIPKLSGTQCSGSGGDHFNPNITYGSFTDDRDGKTYKYVTIEQTTWMAENLNYGAGKGADGNDIGVCYENSPDSCAKYGRLYDWATVMNGSSSSSIGPIQGICPSGWHVPSDTEWRGLVRFVDPAYEDYSNNAGSKLKAKSGWYNDGNGTDDYGFSALPGGKHSGGHFNLAGHDGSWWSDTENDANTAWLRDLHGLHGNADRHQNVKWYMFSLRCVKDY